MSSTESPNLSDTLLLAFSKCRQQEQVLSEQAKLVENLRAENERLHAELQKTRQQPTPQVSNLERRIQELFQENTAKQVEIDVLKTKLHSRQFKAQQRAPENVTSSPLPDESSPAGLSGRKRKLSNSKEEWELCQNNQNRQNLNRTNVTKGGSPVFRGCRNELNKEQRVTLNSAVQKHASPLQSGQKRSLDGRVEKNYAAIAVMAEDGEMYDPNIPCEVATSNPPRMKTPPQGRLNTLLSEPVPSKSPLSGAQLRKQGSSTGTPGRFKHGSASKAKSSIPPSETAIDRPGARRADDRARYEANRSFQSNRDQEPLRTKPLSRLSLSHFRRNPKLNDNVEGITSHDNRARAAMKCLPSCSKSKCCGDHLKLLMDATRTSSEVVPALRNMEEQDLLSWFMGDDVGDRISTMTSIAKENLLQEARTKYIAEALARYKNASDQTESPPELWSVDMPGTPEHEEHRVQASRRIRDEVERRYEEACRDNGVWIFADELD